MVGSDETSQETDLQKYLCLLQSRRGRQIPPNKAILLKINISIVLLC